MPRGDLNHDGVAHDKSASVLTWLGAKKVNEAFQGEQDDEAHFPAVCSDAGTCDELAGLCVCDQGFEGSACQRRTYLAGATCEALTSTRASDHTPPPGRTSQAHAHGAAQGMVHAERCAKSQPVR